MLKSIEHRLLAAAGLTVFHGAQYRFYKDTWDQLSPQRPDSLEAKLLQLPHGQIAQIGLKSGLCLLALPKNANTAMRIWLNTIERAYWGLNGSDGSPIEGAYEGKNQWCHTAAQVPAGLRSRLSTSDVTVLIVVRNPFDRFLSCFRDKRQSPQSPVTRKLPSRAWNSPESLARHLERGNNLFKDGHWAPQSWLAQPLLNDVQFVVHTETLSFDLNQALPDLCKKFPPPSRSEHRGSRTDSVAVRNHLTPYTRLAVQSMFSEDFRLWYPEK